MKIVWAEVFLLMRAMLSMSCKAFGHPMYNGRVCRHLPSVEECQEAAATIRDPCLRNCVIQQCRLAKPACDAATKQGCAERSRLHSNRGQTGGYTDRGPQTCKEPVQEIHWCELPLSRKCRADAMAHELAHSCGWTHPKPGEDH